MYSLKSLYNSFHYNIASLYRNHNKKYSQSSVLYSKQKENNAHTPTKENSVLYENVSGQLYMNQCNALS